MCYQFYDPFHPQSPEQWVGMQRKKRSQSNENKWPQCFFPFGIELGINCWMLSFPSQGRNPFFLEPSVIITITDGNKLTHSSGVPDEVRAQTNVVALPCSIYTVIPAGSVVHTCHTLSRWSHLRVKICKTSDLLHFHLLTCSPASFLSAV